MNKIIRCCKKGYKNFFKYIGGVILVIALFLIVVIMLKIIIISSGNEELTLDDKDLSKKIIVVSLATCVYFLTYFKFYMYSKNIEKKAKSGEQIVKAFLIKSYFSKFLHVLTFFSVITLLMLLFLNIKLDNVKLYCCYIYFTYLIICFLGILLFNLYFFSINPCMINSRDFTRNKPMNKLSRLFRKTIYVAFGSSRFYLRMYIASLCFAIFFIFYFYNNILSNTFIQNYNEMLQFIISIFLIVFLCGWLVKPSEEDKLHSFNINGINIDIETVKKSPIYIMKSRNKNHNFYMFQLNLNELFNENDKERLLFIEEAYNPIFLNAEEVTNLDEYNKALIFFNLNDINQNNILRLRINMSFRTNNDDKSNWKIFLLNQKIVKFSLKLWANFKVECLLLFGKQKKVKKKYTHKYYDVLINLSNYSNIISPAEKYQIGYSKNSFKAENLNKIKELFSCDNFEDLNKLKGIIIQSASSIYNFNDLNEEIKLDKKILDNRKVLIHDKTFGVGKTTYDVLSIVNKEKIPIIVSPWEANYDHDILYLIFETMRKVTSTKVFTIFQGVEIFYFVIVSAFYPFVLDYIKNVVKEFDPKFQYLNSMYLFIYFLLLGGAWLILKMILPHLIIFKKDYTKIYKNFYIDSIVKMINDKPNYILLIEDVDRLSVEAQNETFRILSSINSNLKRNSRIFAILSYDSNKKSDDTNIDYDAINNKIIYQHWGKNYNEILSMKKYAILNLNIINLFLDFDFASICHRLNVVIEHDNTNFRNLYTLFDEVKQTMIDDRGDIINLSSEEVTSYFNSYLEKMESSLQKWNN